MSTTNTTGTQGAPIGSSSQTPALSTPLIEHGLPGSRREWVLVVDDSPLVRVMLRRALERAGFRVVLATSGHEAIQLYRQYCSFIGAVLLDVQMAGVDGPETLAALRGMDPGVRVCFVSGDTGEYLPEDLIRRGAEAVFYKPFQLDDLADGVRRMLNGRPPIRQDEVGPELHAGETSAAAAGSSAVGIDSGQTTT
jgi:CheY-like chemotaxis protein